MKMDRAKAKAAAEKLVAKMTLEEKASQLRYDAPAIERLHIPAYNWWNEALHGVARAGTATVFPQAIGLAAACDPDIMEEIGKVISVEGRAKYNAQRAYGDRDIYKGITFWAPNVNIFRDPRWGRGHETYGEDPFLTSVLAVRFIRGIQGDGKYMRAAACAKHFAVHSGPEALRHQFNAKVSPKDMEETYLPAFEACVKDGEVEAVMGAYNRTNGEVCCASPSLQNILRRKWGFKGHFVSDCWAVRDFHEHHKVTGSPEESAALALQNGTDLNCGCTYQKILDAVKEGLVDEKYITQACVRLFTCRYLLGMFDKTAYDQIPYEEVESPAHLALAEKAAEESLVLLKNNGILPLERTAVKIIGVIGPNANSRSALIGNYHGTSSRYTTVLEGIQKIADASGIRVLYSQGCDLSRDNVEALSKPESADRMAEALTVAECSDVTVLVIGLDETLEGEEGDDGNAYFSGDKKDVAIPPFQMELVRRILDTGRKVILLNMSGSDLDLSLPAEKADAVLQVWYPGAAGGEAVAKVLFGEVSPSGKLPVTFYRSCDDLPAFEDYSMRGRTYRYYDGTPVYPFGFGLTYGDCSVQDMYVVSVTDANTFTRGYTDRKSAFGERKATLSVTVRNDGRETEDVLQIYIHDNEFKDAVPHPALCAVRRIHLGEGEVQTVRIDLPERAFTSVDAGGNRMIRSRQFTVYAGFTQPDAVSCKLSGHSCISKDIEL